MKNFLITILILFLIIIAGWFVFWHLGVKINGYGLNNENAVLNQDKNSIDIKNNSSSTVETIGNTSTNAVVIRQTKDPATGERVPSRFACVGEGCDGSMSGENNFTVVRVPLIKDGGDIGCNAGIFYAPHVVPKTSAVLDATYRMLFDIKHDPEIKEDGFRNTVAGATKLFYDHVILKNGVARVYLAGQMTSPGTCADPEMKAQIESAVFQFDNITKLEVYLNDKIFDWCTMDMSGGVEGACKTGNKNWVVTKGE